ncbi:hypothetical protein [Frankia sp. CiP3]|uniref:hypothetical protein n=1 Tax=Frankia sp. CiP3 TaxID=2880971 RepID=UPI001EF4DFDB|nr:hypothetical protein [Frankia sp. CiP3]
MVTVIAGTVVGLTFLFGLGNVAALGIRLGVPTYVAILVAPAVDLSVVGLLLGARHLTLYGGPTEVIRAARRLLIFASTVTLALNITEPLITGHYGKAAFDAVGPLLLIGFLSAVCVSRLIRRVVSRIAIPAFKPASKKEVPYAAGDQADAASTQAEDQRDKRRQKTRKRDAVTKQRESDGQKSAPASSKLSRPPPHPRAFPQQQRRLTGHRIQ